MCIRTPELEENHAIQIYGKILIQKFNKRRRTYSKEVYRFYFY